MRDFGQVFDAYAQFEESMISALMESSGEMGKMSEDGKYLLFILLIWECFVDDLDLELRLARFESLMDRRPFLLSR